MKTLAGIAMLALIPLLPAAEPDAGAGPAQPATRPGNGSNTGSTPTGGAALQPGQLPVAPVSSGLGEILKMLDAGISQMVIRMYIEASPLAYNLSAADIILLKARGSSDDVVTALLKRGAEVRTQASTISANSAAAAAPNAPASNPAPQHVYAGPSPGYGVLDPESYAYFYHYYLHPRTLASVYQRLGVYGAPYGYLQPFNPGFSFGYAPRLGALPRGGFR